MKTAEEWALTTPWMADENRIAIVKQIQLDAVKEGMRRAAEICDRKGAAQLTTGQCKPYTIAHKAILTAAEQLTEKDL